MSQVETTFETVDHERTVDHRLAEFFAERIASAEDYGDEYRQLWRSAQRASMGGKRLRPAFVMGVYRDLGGRDSAAALDVAAAFELLHTAFLMHDDVIDGDLMRRGVPNLAGEFRRRALSRGVDGSRAGAWGAAAAILAGDLLIHYAQGMIARTDVPSAIRSDLLDVFDRSVFVTAAGELSDVALSIGVGEASLPDVIAMTERKTAAYSFEGPLMAGAILAEAGSDAVDALAKFGRLIGLAFQLGDDILGVFGSPEATGKSAVNDLREGKETLLIAHARTTSSWELIAPRFRSENFTHRDGALIRTELERCGARAFVESMIADYSDRAVEVIACSSLPATLRERLEYAAQRCVGRIS